MHRRALKRRCFDVRPSECLLICLTVAPCALAVAESKYHDALDQLASGKPYVGDPWRSKFSGSVARIPDSPDSILSSSCAGFPYLMGGRVAFPASLVQALPLPERRPDAEGSNSRASSRRGTEPTAPERLHSRDLFKQVGLVSSESRSSNPNRAPGMRWRRRGIASSGARGTTRPQQH